jgi:hypothetical protein
MALLLDQLEEEHILLLDRVVRASLPEEEDDEQLGRVRLAPLEALRYEPEREGAAWVRLHSLGLLMGADGSSPATRVEAQGFKGTAVFVTPLGLVLHRWITDPPMA